VFSCESMPFQGGYPGILVLAPTLGEASTSPPGTARSSRQSEACQAHLVSQDVDLPKEA